MSADGLFTEYSLTLDPTILGLSEEYPQIEIENFGPITRFKAKIKPLTLIVGENNIGKSYVTKAIYAITRELPEITRTKFSDKTLEEVYQYLKNAHEKNEVIIFPKELLQSIFGEMSFDYTKTFEEIFAVEDVQQLIKHGKKKARIIFKTTYFTIRIELSNEKIITEIIPTQEIRVLINEEEIGVSIVIQGIQRPSLKIPLFKIPLSQIDFTFRKKSEMKRYLRTLMEWIMAQLYPTNTVYLPGTRSGLLIANELIAISYLLQVKEAGFKRRYLPNIPGDAGDFLQLVNSSSVRMYPFVLRRPQKERYKKTLDFLVRRLLKGKIIINRSDLTRSIYYKDNKGQIYHLHRTSSLITELAPLYLILTRSALEKGSIFIYEEPESHLHPQAQLDLAELLLLLQHEFKGRIILTLHSTFQLEYFVNQAIHSKTTHLLEIIEIIEKDGETESRKLRVTKGGLEEDPYIAQVTRLYNQEISNESS